MDLFSKNFSLAMADVVDKIPQQLISMLEPWSMEYIQRLDILRRLYEDASLEHFDPKTNTRSRHVGDSNYSENKIQPWDIWIEYSLNPWDADIVKRILRKKVVTGRSEDEMRIEDYEKIQHICQERIDQIKNGNPYYKK